MAKYIFPLYVEDFMGIITLVKQIMEDIMKNISLLPNSIKYICKIISILIKRKFKNIKKSEQNDFISKFIIGKLLIPILEFPSYNAYIGDFIISEKTLKNIQILNYIIKKLFSGKLFYNNLEEGEYVPFNRFFIEKMEEIFNFYEKSITVNLPSFIEKYVNDELPKDYSYDFFNENKQEMFAKISISFTIENLNYLVKGLEKCQDILLTNNLKIIKRSYDKLKNEEFFNTIKNIDIKKKESHMKQTKDKGLEIINYYAYNDNVIEKKYEKLFSITLFIC